MVLSTPRVYRIRKAVRPLVVNAALILVCALMLFPVLSTLLLSVKQQSDVRRKPPVFLPCDTPSQPFNLRACRFSAEGYERTLLPRPNPRVPLAVEITVRIYSTYFPSTLFYQLASAVLMA